MMAVGATLLTVCSGCGTAAVAVGAAVCQCVSGNGCNTAAVVVLCLWQRCWVHHGVSGSVTGWRAVVVAVFVGATLWVGLHLGGCNTVAVAVGATL